MMYFQDQINVKLYSHNLKQVYRSFDTNLTVKDFHAGLEWTIIRAKKVTYVNPKGEELVLKDKK